MELCLSSQDSLAGILEQYPGAEPLIIRLAPGIYREKLRICHHNLQLIGSGRYLTILTFDDYNDKLHADGQPYNTFRTPSVTILADNVSLANLTIRNPAGYGKGVGQAVALSVYGDNFKLEDACLEGFQDTLFCGPLPADLTIRYQGFLPHEELATRPLKHFFKHVTIKGHVDFIFGGATALFDQCEIVSLMPGYVAAPSTAADCPVGFVFHDCVFRNQAPAGSVYLARPWREHGFACFWNCRYEGEFHKDRFHDWDKKTYRFYEIPYVETSMSRSLSEERISDLKTLIEQLFNCSLAN